MLILDYKCYLFIDFCWLKMILLTDLYLRCSIWSEIYFVLLTLLTHVSIFLLSRIQEYLHFNRVVLLPVKLILQSGLDQKLGKLGNLGTGNFFLRVFLIQVFSFYCRTKYRKWKNFEHYFRNSRVLTCHLIFRIKKINILK